MDVPDRITTLRQGKAEGGVGCRSGRSEAEAEAGKRKHADGESIIRHLPTRPAAVGAATATVVASRREPYAPLFNSMGGGFRGRALWAVVGKLPDGGAVDWTGQMDARCSRITRWA